MLAGVWSRQSKSTVRERQPAAPPIYRRQPAMPPLFQPAWPCSASNAFPLPAHFEVGPTASDLRQVVVRGLPLPLHETFGDSYAGKCFIRIPRKEDLQPVHGRAARLRSEQPSMTDSLWLPDYCIVGARSLEQGRSRLRPRSSPALRGRAAPLATASWR